MRLIDIAVNLTDRMFRGFYHGKQVHADDFSLVLERAYASGIVRMLITGTSLEESREAVILAQQDDRLFSTVGCHPTRCQEFLEDPDAYWNQLRAVIRAHPAKVIAVGECGLDYDRLQFCPADVQRTYFEKQLELAAETRLPLFLHNRNTNGDFVEIMRRYRSKVVGGVVHSFDGTMEEMRTLTDELQLYIGVNGCSMKTAENLEVVKQIPLDRLMIETDAPWCDLRPTHASYPYLEPAGSKHISQRSCLDSTARQEEGTVCER